MDGLAPRTRRSDRSMVSFIPARPSERHAPGTGPIRTSERSSQARALPAADDASLTLGRRIGVLVVLAALGGAIVLAASGGGGDRTSGVVVAPTQGVVAVATTPGGDPATTGVPLVGSPTGQPAFVTPGSTLVNTRKVNLRVRVPEPGVPWDGLELRVLRGGSEVLTRAIGPTDVNSKGRATLKGIPLKRGSNKLTLALANATGQGPVSETLTIKLDDQPPRLKVVAPRDGMTIQGDSVTVRGRTVAGMRVVVRNVTTDQKEVVVAGGDGRFQAQLRLKRGRDTIKVAVSDAAGNQNPVQVTIVRGNGKAEARLSLSRARIKRSALPRHIDATVSVLDANGRPIKGATVVFTFGPPGAPAQVRTMSTSKDGTATWSGIRVVKDAVVGDGLVTVRVTLPDGRELPATRGFKIV